MLLKFKYKFFIITFSFLFLSLSNETSGVDLNRGANFRDCEDCPMMTIIAPGSFIMGSNKTERMRGNEIRPEGPIRKMTISFLYMFLFQNFLQLGHLKLLT